MPVKQIPALLHDFYVKLHKKPNWSPVKIYDSKYSFATRKFDYNALQAAWYLNLYQKNTSPHR